MQLIILKLAFVIYLFTGATAVSQEIKQSDSNSSAQVVTISSSFGYTPQISSTEISFKLSNSGKSAKECMEEIQGTFEKHQKVISALYGADSSTAVITSRNFSSASSKNGNKEKAPLKQGVAIDCSIEAQIAISNSKQVAEVMDKLLSDSNTVISEIKHAYFATDSMLYKVKLDTAIKDARNQAEVIAAANSLVINKVLSVSITEDKSRPIVHNATINYNSSLPERAKVFLNIAFSLSQN